MLLEVAVGGPGGDGGGFWDSKHCNQGTPPLTLRLGGSSGERPPFCFERELFHKMTPSSL